MKLYLVWWSWDNGVRWHHQIGVTYFRKEEADAVARFIMKRYNYATKVEVVDLD